MNRYPMISRFVAETPWAIMPEKLAVIMEVVNARARGERISADDLEARVGPRPAAPAVQDNAAPAVAVIPLHGTIVPRATMMSSFSGGASAEAFAESVSRAAADPRIDGIVLDISSPGGAVSLVPEAAAAVRAARDSKPVVAVANTLAASAAYWIASQASEIVVTPSGEVGSIGVIAAHEDLSVQLEQEGVATTLITAGKYKGEANPFGPLTDEARAAIQQRVDEFYAMFVGDVAAGRGVAVSDVTSGFGEGRVLTASQALAAGMVDRIDTLEGAIERVFVQTRSGGVPTRAEAPPGDVSADLIDVPGEAAASGLSFVSEALAVRDAAIRLDSLARSLREVKRGRPSGAKRDALASAAEAVRAAADTLDALVAETDPYAAEASGTAALIWARNFSYQKEVTA